MTRSRTSRPAATAITAAALLALGLALTACGSDSEEDVAERCRTALIERDKSETGKPAVCDGIDDEAYEVLVVSVVLNELDWVDEEGGIDVDKVPDADE